MATLFDDASLVMIPSGYKDDKLYSIKPTSGDGDFTFSRDGSGASPATRVNSAGLIEKGRTNLLLQSNTFDTTWIQSDITTLTSGQSGYDGTNDAWLVEKSASANGYLRQNISSSGVNTFSLYAKSNTLNGVLIQTRGASTRSAQFNLSTGAIGTTANNIDAKIEDVGNGWYRCSVSVNDSGITQVRIFICDDGTTIGTTAGSIYIQDAQLEKGLVATSVIETTTAAASAGILGDMPRLDYSGGASCPSLLLEPSRTNLLPHSEYLNFSGYTLRNITATDNYAVSPEGVQNATRLVGTGSDAAVLESIVVTSGTEYTLSVYLKSTSGSDVNSSISLGSAGFPDGDGDGGKYKSIVVTSEWQRFTLTSTADASTSTDIAIGGFGGFDSGEDILAYGFQFESGSYPTSYIPTYGSATARAKDSSEATGLGSSLGSTEGTIFLEVSALSNDLSERRFALSNGTTGNVARVGFTNVSNRILAVLYNGSNQCVLTYAGADITQTNKIAFTYAANDFALYVNGESRSTDTFGSTFTAGTLTEVHFNEGDGNGNESFGNFKQVVIFPTRLSNAELAALTTL